MKIPHTKWGGLNRNKRPAQISPRKIEKLNAEVDERIKLAKRCGGTPVISTRGIICKDGVHLLTTVKCYIQGNYPPITRTGSKGGAK